jgi:hypothetical protein
MDHRAISNTVDSTGAFRVAGAATGEVPSFAVVLFCYVKRPLRKLATDVFDLLA